MQQEPKHKYGEYKHVLLTDRELEKLKADYGDEETAGFIKYLDEYIEEKTYRSKSHYLAIKRWVINAYYRQRQETHKYNYAPKYKEVIPNYGTASEYDSSIDVNELFSDLKELGGTEK